MHDRRRALKKTRYLSLKVTERGGAADVDLTGVILALTFSLRQIIV
jgi:hypothetical protein